MTEWRSFPGLPAYEVSEYGHVRRIAPQRGAQVGKVLRPLTCRATGYLRYRLSQNGRVTTHLVHRAVAEAFFGPPPPGACAAHWDGNKTNNHISNLRWATSAENTEDTRRHGTMVVGERSRHAVLTEEEVRKIRGAHADNPRKSRRSTAKEYGVAHTTINKIVSRVLWKHL